MSRRATEAEQAECRRVGCEPAAWRAGCPLHGFPALIERIDGAKGDLKGIMVEAATKHADVRDHLSGTPGFWESQAVRAELALLALTAPAPILLLEALRSQLRATVEPGTVEAIEPAGAQPTDRELRAARVIGSLVSFVTTFTDSAGRYEGQRAEVLGDAETWFEGVDWDEEVSHEEVC